MIYFSDDGQVHETKVNTLIDLDILIDIYI